MTKAQALQLANALEARSMPCDILLRFPAGGQETWSVQLDTTRTYMGADLAALTTYCANNGLTLSIIVSEMGVT